MFCSTGCSCTIGPCGGFALIESIGLLLAVSWPAGPGIEDTSAGCAVGVGVDGGGGLVIALGCGLAVVSWIGTTVGVFVI